METKNLKYGIKCTKNDVALVTSYVVLVMSKNYSKNFSTKLEAINHITEILGNPDISKDNVSLTKVQLIKF